MPGQCAGLWNLWTEPAADRRGKVTVQAMEPCDGAQRCLSHRRVECSRTAQVTHALPEDPTSSLPRSPWGLQPRDLPSCKCQEFLSPSETSSCLHPVHPLARPKTTFSGRGGRSCPPPASLWSQNLLPTLRTQAHADPPCQACAALPAKLPLQPSHLAACCSLLSHCGLIRSRPAE